MWLFLLLACPKAPEPTALPVTTPPSAEVLTAAPSFAPLEEQVARMLASVDQGDQLDRLVILQEFLLKTRGMDATAQKALYVYAEQLVQIEQRSLPMPIAEPSGDTTIMAVDPSAMAPILPDPADRIDAARKSVEQHHYEDAIRQVEGMTELEAVKVRESAKEAWFAEVSQEVTDLLVASTRLEGAARREPLLKAQKLLQNFLGKVTDSAEAKAKMEEVSRELEANPG